MKRLAIAFLGFVIGVAAVLALLQLPLQFSPWASGSESRDTQIINSVTREQQVVLLSLGIQGISEKTENSTIFGIDVPGSTRASFVQYSFSAKLGINGADVHVVSSGEDSYRLIIPEFVFIGHDDESFRLVAEDNGALSWVTPRIDAVEVVNSILDDEGREQYTQDNLDILEDQAETFYSGIISSIDPAASVTFEFHQKSR